jgi:nucleotide-binding universal stress UspA family protein
MYKQILCPVDGSLTSNCGMVEAIQLAKDQKAKLRFFHVIDKYFPIMDATGDFNMVYIDDILRANGKKVLKKAEAAARKEGLEADSSMVEAIGARVSKFLLNQAKEWPADFIVMGSDAETVVHNSIMPILLVRRSKRSRRL